MKSDMVIGMTPDDEPVSAADLAYLNDERFLSLLDTLPFPAFVVIRSGLGATYNTAFIDYVGCEPGPRRADRTALHHPDDHAALEAARAAAVDGDRSYVVEARLRRHDGAYRWHRIHNKPVFREGRRVAYLGTAVDVHDGRTAHDLLEARVRERTAALDQANEALAAREAKYRELYDQTPIALQSAGPGARLLDVNQTWLSTFGYDRAEVIGRSPTAFMTPESARKYRDVAWPGMLGSDGQVRTVDYQFVTASGTIFDGRLTAKGVFDGEGRLVRTWSAIVDITAERRANQLLQQAQRLDALGQLTAGIAHDFNNLLTAILGSLELASRLDPGETERQARLIGGARSAAERGARLTSQLLAFSRQQRITAVPVDVNAILGGMAPLFETTMTGACRVVVASTPDLPLALADTAQLELAVLNLVLNARDALDGKGQITVGTSLARIEMPAGPEEPQPGPYVAVWVRDDGPGIPEAVRARVFEPFFTTKEAGRGSGLGLPQVLGIAKQLGGGVRLSSPEGGGTDVAVLLPLAPASGGDSAPDTDPAHPEVTEARGRILLVDDDAEVRAVAAAILRDAGHAVVEADSGAAALSVLEAERDRFDLLITDVLMPGMTGPGLAELVRRAWPELGILFMTGYADIDKFPECRPQDVVAKPFNAATLESRVSLALKQSTIVQPAAAQLEGSSS